MKNKAITIVILVIVIAAGVYWLSTLNPIQKDEIEIEQPVDSDIEIKLEVQAPFSTATLTISGEGNISYLAQVRNQELIADSSTITSEEFEALMSIVTGNDFFSLEDPPDESELADESVYTITLIGQEDINVVSCKASLCEEGFNNIKDAIAELWGKEIAEVGV